MSVRSCLYEGVVRHNRRTAPSHRFHRRLFMVFLDLDELPQLFRDRWFWSVRRTNVAWFRRADYLGPAERPLDQSVRDLVEERLGRWPSGPVRLLTHLRYFGIAMNPISIYYCYDSADRLDAVVAEVTNTPWGERHHYVLDIGGHAAAKFEAEAAKAMHVSPYLEMDYDYRFRLTTPGERLMFAVSDVRHGSTEPDFTAYLHMRRLPFDGRSAARMLLRYPAMTAGVFLTIYRQAFRLWWKGVPFVPHPQTRPDEQRSAALIDASRDLST